MTEKSTASDLSQTKLLESGKAARRLLARLGRARLSPREMSDTIALIGRETSVVRAWIHTIHQISTHGARAFAKANPTAASDAGLNQFGLAQVDDSNDREPWLIPAVRQRFSDECRIQFHLRMMSMDNLSQLGSLALDSTEDSEKWDAINPLCWTAWGKRGAIGLIKGRIKSGKTNLSLLLGQHFMDRGYLVVSNIAVSEAPRDYVYASTLSSMLIATCQTRLEGREICLILDEGALYWHKIQTVMKMNVDLSKLLMCFGKLHIVLCFICHEEEQVPGVIARMHCASWEKKDLTSVFVEITDGPLKLRPRLLTHVPPTALRYDPDQLQYFSLDLNIDELFNFMSNIPQGQNQWKLVIDYVHRHRGEQAEENLSPKEVALYLRKKGLSEKKISEAIQKAPSTIHEWVKVEK